MPGIPLGYDHEEQGGQVLSLQMNLDDSLFFFTDGLIENKGPDGRILKPIKLKKLIEYGLSPKDMAKKVETCVADIWQDEPAEDDCTFLIVRWIKKLSDHNAA